MDPIYQGRGYGSALMKRALQQIDDTPRPAYLDATSEGSAALYERHGFERLGVVQVGLSPPFVSMVRPAR